MFIDGEVKLNTTGAEFFGMGWANQSATGLICQVCGYVHVLAFWAELWDPLDGYPDPESCPPASRRYGGPGQRVSPRASGG
jgi:hypothetical protein